MRILLTGASSFTGYWFAKTLVQKGHEVVAPLPRTKSEYQGIRATRVNKLSDVAEIAWAAPFGSAAFIDLLNTGSWDRLCHHAAHVGDYRSPDYDVASALKMNTHNLSTVLKIMKGYGLTRVVLTGSVFEANEGHGTHPLRAFSPYGLAKSLTADVFKFYCDHYEIPMTKFVIPNPFGPYEEPRFCNYLLQCWQSGKTASVKTPAYIRDNIHASLLALCYTAQTDNTSDRHIKSNPSGYAESQGAFAQRFAQEIGSRLNIDCPLDLPQQLEFPEPHTRVNTDTPDWQALGWNEKRAWDELADYYQNLHSAEQ